MIWGSFGDCKYGWHHRLVTFIKVTSDQVSEAQCWIGVKWETQTKNTSFTFYKPHQSEIFNLSLIWVQTEEKDNATKVASYKPIEWAYEALSRYDIVLALN